MSFLYTRSSEHRLSVILLRAVMTLIYMCEEPASAGHPRTSHAQLHLTITTLPHCTDEKTAIGVAVNFARVTQNNSEFESRFF